MKITALTDSATFILGQAAPAPGPGGAGMQLVIMALMFGAMYFFLIAPQRKKQKEHEKMVAALEAGDEVLLSSGIYGEIAHKKEDRFLVKIASDVKVEVAKGFVQSVVKKSGSK